MIPVGLPPCWSETSRVRVHIFILSHSSYLLFSFHLVSNSRVDIINNRLLSDGKHFFHLQQRLKHTFKINHEHMTTLITWIKGRNWSGSFPVQSSGLWTICGGCTLLLSTTPATHNKNTTTISTNSNLCSIISKTKTSWKQVFQYYLREDYCRCFCSSNKV